MIRLRRLADGEMNYGKCLVIDKERIFGYGLGKFGGSFRLNPASECLPITKRRMAN